MNIIICGAGRVGFSISKQLSAQGHSITVIDQSSEFIQKINETQDVKGVVGRATGGDFGFRLNKSIALGMVKPNLAKVGQKLEIDILGKMHKVSIIEDSPYDPENKLLRA